MKSFTPYSSVNKILDYLLINTSDILNDQLIGMYIHGSLALNDFVPDRSDIDLVIVTKNTLTDNLLEKLKFLHERITLSDLPYSKRIECIYIPIKSLKNYSQEKAYFPCLHVGGKFYIDGFGLIEKYILRENGITIKGQNPKLFIKPVTPSELKRVAFESLKNWWLPQLTNHSRLVKDDYQVYAILTMCRAFYTIENGDIVSKSKAASFVKKTLDKKWTLLIDEALLWKIGKNFNHLKETLDFIQFTLNKLGCE